MKVTFFIWIKFANVGHGNFANEIKNLLRKNSIIDKLLIKRKPFSACKTAICWNLKNSLKQKFFKLNLKFIKNKINNINYKKFNC